ncbi:16S rRNA (uracil(1498)-N(3))-methyltransferase [Haloferula sp.]|uniref:16S rRNA (uracil(1498)-N(3))-methyltransferase n=1 Tax=Haloferula sp. TaxID=2497595 RepID=UPI003C71FACB
MPRFYLEPAAWNGEPALVADEAKHCSRVLRAKPGDRITVFDGEGRSSEAEILALTKGRVDLRLGKVELEAEPKVRVVLAQAVIKGKAMDWLLQKAVELGVDEIQPLATRHAVVQPGDGKEDKWQRAVLEACKQCGRSRVPRVLPITLIEDFFRNTQSHRRIIASLGPDAQPLRDHLSKTADLEKVIFLVGPEGDFSQEESRKAIDSGWLEANLGSRVLRSETAAVFCLASASYAFS